MPKNNVDQAPKIRSTGEKFPNDCTWGKAIRTHELETIFANCIDTKAFVQYKVMMFLTAQAEEKFDVSLVNVMTRCNISKDAYYKARAALIEKGWLSLKNEGDKSYIIIHYDKIYEDGKKQCTFLPYTLKESMSLNTSDESKLQNFIDKKEGYSINSTDEGNFLNTTDESMSKNTTDKQSTFLNTSQKEGTSLITNEGYCLISEESKWNKSQYNINDNIKENNIEAKVEEFNREWGKSGGNNILTGAAARF